LDEDKYIRVEQTEENILGTATANSVSTTQIQPSLFSGLLDEYPNAAGAYSLRKLTRLYSGSAIKVRRDSDQALQDIGFLANGELDIASLESFCSGTDGFVHTWYDQSGNGYDATQTTAAEQPKIVSSGSTILENGKAAVQFDNSDDDLLQSLPNDFYGTNDIYCFLVTTNASSSETGGLTQKRNSVLDGNFGVGATYGKYQIQARDTDTGDAVLSTTGSYDSQQLFSASRDYLGLEIHSPETKSISSSVADLTSTNDSEIGAGSSYGAFGGFIQEVVIYTSDESTNRTGIETNINDFYNIY